MRLFAAVDLDAPARAAAVRSARALAIRLNLGDQPSPVRWVAPEQLHFTLRFLGEVPDRQAESVRRAFREPWETGAFAAGLTGVDVFPFSGAPRVIWRGVDEGLERMGALKTELDRRLASLGFEPETKLFRAHLTLGRVKRGATTSGSALRALLGDHRSETTGWVVDRVTLYESRLSFRKATYHAVESAMLPASLETDGRTPP